MNLNLHIDLFLKKRLLVFMGSLFLFTSILSLFSCVSTKSTTSEAEDLFSEQTYIPETFVWTEFEDFPCISFYDFVSENNDFPVKYHLIKIDLKNSNLKLVSYPQNYSEKHGTKPKSLSDFAQEQNCVVAINTNPFSRTIFSQKIKGLFAPEGKILSAPEERYASLVFLKASESYLKATIIPSQNEFSAIKDAKAAFGGFFSVLQDKTPLNFAIKSYDRRSAAGVSEDGSILYLLLVEENPGLSYQQCAKLFLNLNCESALEFDGGSSAELYLNGKTFPQKFYKVPQATGFGFAKR